MEEHSLTNQAYLNNNNNNNSSSKLNSLKTMPSTSGGTPQQQQQQHLHKLKNTNKAISLYHNNRIYRHPNSNNLISHLIFGRISLEISEDTKIIHNNRMATLTQTSEISITL